MKVKTFLKISAAALLMISGAASATIVGSLHDLSVTGTDGNTDPALGLTFEGLCIYCHVPHNAVTAAAPLWNRPDSGVTFVMYDDTVSATLDMDTATVPDPFSMACLSCHDGVTALDAMVSNSGWGAVTAGSNNLVTWGSMGADLTNDHPISIRYNAAQDTEFNAIGTGEVGGLPLFAGTAGGAGAADQVECASCHDVHDQDTYFPFLRMDNAGSALCLTCHDK